MLPGNLDSMMARQPLQPIIHGSATACSRFMRLCAFSTRVRCTGVTCRAGRGEPAEAFGTCSPLRRRGWTRISEANPCYASRESGTGHAEEEAAATNRGPQQFLETSR